MADRGHLEEAVALMCLYWPHMTVTPAQALACYRQWEQVPPGALVAAMDKLARTERWCPGPGIIAAVALDALAPQRSSAGEVLAEVLGEVARVGRYGTPVLSVDARLAVESVGGWGAVCSHDAEFLPNLLRKAYEGRVFDEREARLEPESWRAVSAVSAVREHPELEDGRL